MGGEIFVILTAVLGAITLALLLFFSHKASRRAYALPTLLFSLVAAFCMANTASVSNFILTFFSGLFLASTVFGIHAIYIKLLSERNT